MQWKGTGFEVSAGHKRLCVLSHVESVSSVEGSRTRRRRRRRRTRPRSQTPSGEHVDCGPSDHLPGGNADIQGESYFLYNKPNQRMSHIYNRNSSMKYILITWMDKTSFK